jgi:hypothetical protein
MDDFERIPVRVKYIGGVVIGLNAERYDIRLS